MTAAPPAQISKNLRALLVNHELLRTGHADAKDIIVLEGGSGSSKTWSICEYLDSVAYHWDKMRAACYRFDSTNHDDGAMADLRDVISMRSLSVRENRSSKLFTWKSGATLRFKGAQDPQKAHGPRFDIVWLNEAMELQKDFIDQAMQRTRWLTLIDFNPSLTQHPIFDMLLDSRSPLHKRVLHVHSTFQDNPHLSDNERQKILSYDPDNKANITTADHYKWQVYGLGKRARREGAVFGNWKLCYEWPERYACQRHGYGLDFGWRDPCALIECALWQGALYLREVVYESELVVAGTPDAPDIPSLVRKMREAKVPGDASVDFDCASPESARLLQLSGFRMVPTAKGPESVAHGIDLMKSVPIYVWHGSVNLQREFENYTWKEAPRTRTESRWQNTPIDEWNHGIDAARYWALRNLRKRERDGGRKRPRELKTPLSRW